MYSKYLDWIDDQQESLNYRLEQWAAINSGSYNFAGLERMAEAVAGEFASLGGEQFVMELRPAESIDSRGEVIRRGLGRAIIQGKRMREAPLRVLLAIHYDTVY